MQYCGVQSSTGATISGGEADPFAVGISSSPEKEAAPEQKAQQLSDDPFAARSSSSPAPKSAPATGVMKANLATPPKKSAADILKMFDSPNGQVRHEKMMLLGLLNCSVVCWLFAEYKVEKTQCGHPHWLWMSVLVLYDILLRADASRLWEWRLASDGESVSNGRPERDGGDASGIWRHAGMSAEDILRTPYFLADT